MTGKRTYSLAAQATVIIQSLEEALKAPGGLAAYLEEHAIAVERGPAVSTVEILLVPGEPLFWLRVTATTATLHGSWVGQHLQHDLDVPAQQIAAIQRGSW